MEGKKWVMNRQEKEEEILNEQRFEIKKPFTWNEFEKKIEKRAENFKKKHGNRKIDHRFQEIGLELQEWFGGNPWFIFYKPEATIDKIKRAFEICKKKQIKSIGYLLGIIQKS